MFFGGMSNWIGKTILQLPNIWARAALRRPHWFAEDCMLCGASCAAGPLCWRCAETLPRLGAYCERCASPLAGTATCGACRKRPFAFDEAVACFEYRFPVDRLVQRFKYSADLAIGRWLARELARRVEGEPRPDVLVAPPLSGARLRERGFNQGVELAKAVGSQLGVRCDSFALTRARQTPPRPVCHAARGSPTCAVHSGAPGRWRAPTLPSWTTSLPPGRPPTRLRGSSSAQARGA